MKKFFALLLVACMMLSVLVACGGGEDATKAPTTEKTEAQGSENAQPSATEPQAQPSATEPQAQPSATEPQAQPSATEPQAQPSATEPQAQPSATEPAAPSATEPAEPSATEPAEPSATEPAEPSATEAKPTEEEIEIPDDAILFHTPKVDGILDEAYLESFHFSSLNCLPDAADAANYTSSNEGYVLWDGEYIYVALIVFDDDLITRGLEYINGINKNGDNNPWANDSVDLFYSFEGNLPTDKTTVRKICLDRMGLGPVKTAPSEGFASNHFSDASGAVTYVIDYDTTKEYKDMSILEFKIPAKAENSDEFLQADDTVCFAAQINDIATGAGNSDPDANPGTTWTKAAQRMWYNEETGECGYAEGTLTNIKPKNTGAGSSVLPDVPKSEIPENGVLFHKPVVDGILDTEYLMSAQFESLNCLPDAADKDTYTSANEAYVLWDGEYIYVAVIVYDDDLVTRGLEYIDGINKGGDNNPWANDSVDLFYSFEGNLPTDKTTVRKLCLDRMGIGAVKTAPGEGFGSNHFSDCAGAATYTIDYDTTNVYKDRSVLEFKIPAKSENSDEFLQIEDAICFAIQVNDIAEDGGDKKSDPDFNPGTTWTKAAQRMWYNEETGECGYAELELTGIRPSQVVEG